jgi:hypothetical protein
MIAKIGQKYRVSIIGEKQRCRKTSENRQGRPHEDSS